MRPEDAQAAASYGADAIGLVFHRPARRCVTLEQAEQILQMVPAFVSAVGLFVDAPADEIRATATRLRLRHVQLHGNESPQVVEELRDFSVIKAIRVERDSFGQTLQTWRDAIATGQLHHLKGLVLETAGVSQGGSGQVNDWGTIRRHIELNSFDGLPPIIAAGGLTPENVRDVVKELRPFAVDVSSGVEGQIGQKSQLKMSQFAREVRTADQFFDDETSTVGRF